MNRIYSILLAGLALVSITLVGCRDDNGPEPSTVVANFTFEANELAVDFTNTSAQATDYTWDFGDGNTSTEENPSHTYAEEGMYTVKLTARGGSETNEISRELDLMLDPENVRLQSGYIVTGQTETGSWFAQYFEELPTGVVDITQGTAFQTFFPLSVRDGAFYLARTDGSAGFAKMGVNGRQEFVEDGIIATISPESFVCAVRDADFGVFHDRNDPNKINTFDPQTMMVTGEIDMTVANEIVTDAVRYQDFIFRGEDEIFAPMRLEAGGNVPDVSLGRIDVATAKAVDVPQFEGAGDLVVLNSGRRFVAENGDFYFWHAGDIGFPTVSGAILKIPAGATDYDPNYNFKVPEVNNPLVTGAGSFMSSFNYYKEGTGFALINTELDPQIIQIVQNAGGAQNLTDADIQQIQFLLFNSPTGTIVEVDLEAQSVRNISGLPALSVFDNSGVNFLNGKPYFSVSNPNVNALYEYDEMTGSVTKVFDVMGASISTVIDLSAQVQ